MRVREPSFAIVRGVFLRDHQKFKIAPTKRIENLYTGGDYLEGLNPGDAVIIDLEEAFDRHMFENVSRMIHDDLCREKRRILEMRKDLVEPGGEPDDHGTSRFLGEMLVGLTVQVLHPGTKLTSFGEKKRGVSFFTESTVEKMLVEMRQLIKAYAKKKKSSPSS